MVWEGSVFCGEAGRVDVDILIKGGCCRASAAEGISISWSRFPVALKTRVKLVSSVADRLG